MPWVGNTGVKPHYPDMVTAEVTVCDCSALPTLPRWQRGGCVSLCVFPPPELQSHRQGEAPAKLLGPGLLQRASFVPGQPEKTGCQCSRCGVIRWWLKHATFLHIESNLTLLKPYIHTHRRTRTHTHIQTTASDEELRCYFALSHSRHLCRCCTHGIHCVQVWIHADIEKLTSAAAQSELWRKSLSHSQTHTLTHTHTHTLSYGFCTALGGSIRAVDERRVGMCDVNLTLLRSRVRTVANLTLTPSYLPSESDLSHILEHAHAHRGLLLVFFCRLDCHY